MVDRELALEALSAVFNAEVTSVQKEKSEPWYKDYTSGGAAKHELNIRQQSILQFMEQFFPHAAEQQQAPTPTGAAQPLLPIGPQSILQFMKQLFLEAAEQQQQQQQQQPPTLTGAAQPLPPINQPTSTGAAELLLHIELLSIHHIIPRVLSDGVTSQPAGLDGASRHDQPLQQQAVKSINLREDLDIDRKTGKLYMIDEKEFFDPGFDYDFTKLKDTVTYYRGEEVYKRPCGWHRLALKVLDKYDENTWLGNPSRSTQSVKGEWPVSYHGTTAEGAEGIIEGYYKPGNGQVYGRGVYSSPYISVVVNDGYAKTFKSNKIGKTYRVVLQNRINPEHRVKTKNINYWLVRIPKGKSAEEEKKMSVEAIRPYGLLLKEV